MWLLVLGYGTCFYIGLVCPQKFYLEITGEFQQAIDINYAFKVNNYYV